MTIKELNKLYYKKKDITALEEELAELNNLGSAPLDEMPKSKAPGNQTENYVIKRLKIISDLKQAYEEYYNEYEKVSGFINHIEDDEIRLIARLRFISLKDWFYIAEEISPEHKTIHWTTPRKKLKKYLEENENDKCVQSEALETEN